MTEERLAQLKALCEAATPGPWAVGELGKWPVAKDGRCAQCSDNNAPIGHMVRGAQAWHEHVESQFEWSWHQVVSLPARTEIAGNYDYEDGGIASTPEDAAFIAEARMAFPELLAEVDQLRAEVRRLRTLREEAK